MKEIDFFCQFPKFDERFPKNNPNFVFGDWIWEKRSVPTVAGGLKECERGTTKETEDFPLSTKIIIKAIIVALSALLTATQRLDNDDDHSANTHKSKDRGLPGWDALYFYA